MDYELGMQIAVLVASVVVVRGMIELSRQIETGLSELDGKIAGAIQSVIESGLSEFEPVNPIQQAIASILQSKIEEQKSTMTLTRDQDGKFS